jgi:hypothetical protein
MPVRGHTGVEVMFRPLGPTHHLECATTGWFEVMLRLLGPAHHLEPAVTWCQEACQ